MRTHSLLSILIAILFSMLGGPALSEPEIAGISSVVNPQASAQHEQSAHREIRVGDNVYRNERISTDERGQVQVLFVDKTSLTIGPNSDLVIDEFIYNPDKNTADMAITLTKGVLRFVGGQSSKGESVDIKTPQATIGIRGGIALVRVTDAGLQVIFLFGDELTVNAADGQSASLTRTGFMVTISPDGKLTIERAPAQLIAEILAELQDQSNNELAEGSTIDLFALDDEIIEALANADAAGLGPLTLQDLETELGLDEEKFEQLRNIINEFGLSQMIEDEPMMSEGMMQEEMTDEMMQEDPSPPETTPPQDDECGGATKGC